MLPRVDLPDLIDVMAWQRGFVAAFAGVSGGRSRLADLHVTIAAALTAHALKRRLRSGDLRRRAGARSRPATPQGTGYSLRGRRQRRSTRLGGSAIASILSAWQPPLGAEDHRRVRAVLAFLGSHASIQPDA